MSLDENEGDQEINFDPREIAACQWTSIDQWADAPEKHPVPVTLHIARLAIDVLDGHGRLLEPDRIEVKSQNADRPPWTVMMYRNKPQDKQKE